MPKLNDTGLFVVNQDGVNYALSAELLKEYTSPLAKQEQGDPYSPGVPGMVIPGEGFVYNETTGLLDVNIPSGLVYAGLIGTNTLNDEVLEPDPDQDVPGYFYIVAEEATLCNDVWEGITKDPSGCVVVHINDKIVMNYDEEWDVIPAITEDFITVGPTPPNDPKEGNLWWESEIEKELYIWVLDAYGNGEWVLVKNDDRYMMKAGDTMTGALVMDDAGEIEMINTALEMRRTMPDDGSGNWDPNRDRFGTIRPRAPRIINADGSETIDGNDYFGINFDLSDRNTYRNSLKVSSKKDEIFKVTSGANPALTFNNQINRDNLADKQGIESGVAIRGIPTPDRDDTPGDFAVNKEYVDKEDAILLNGIIDLQEEIEAIAPSLEKGAWEWDPNTNITQEPGEGKFYLLSGTYPSWNTTDEYSQADAVVFNRKDVGGTDHTNWDSILGDPNNPDTNKLILLFDKPDPDKCLGKITNIRDIGEASNPFANSVYVEFTRTEGFGKPNNKLDDDGKYITYVNIFQEPSGGTASEFVLKKGDQMTGALTLKTTNEAIEWDHNNLDAKLTFKNTKSDGTNSYIHLFKNGNGQVLNCDQAFRTTDNLILGSGKELKAKTSSGTDLDGRIKFDTDWMVHQWGAGGDRFVIRADGGDLKHGSKKQAEWTTSGGKLKYNDNPRLEWNSNRVDIIKPVSNTTTADGFLVRGATTSSNNYTSNTIGSQAGSLLVVKHVSNQPDHIEYRGKITESTDIVNKAYVDNNINGNVINGNWNGNNSSKITITKSSGVYYISGG